MTSPDEPWQTETFVLDADSDVWLVAPHGDQDRASWRRHETARLRARFGAGRFSREGRMLAAVLGLFAGYGNRASRVLVRMSAPWQAHLVVLVDVWQGADAWRFAAEFRDYDDRHRWVGGPETVLLDTALGLHRSLRVVAEPDGSRTATLRYHRRVEDPAVDVCISCTGAPEDEVRAALGELDDLARSVRLLDTGAPPRGQAPVQR